MSTETTVHPEQIDKAIEHFNANNDHKMAQRNVQQGESPTDFKPTFDLKTIWPIIKMVIMFVRPLIRLKPSWLKMIDSFIVGMDAITV